VSALAGPTTTANTIVRAHAAYTLAKQGTLNLLSVGDGRLNDAERSELLAAAFCALDP
jgi:hypothetical protein